MSLLTAVRKYPVGNNDPLENFISESWAWTLSNYSRFSTEFVKWFFNITDSEIVWKTQQYYNGYIDLIGISETNILIFEHKIDAVFQKDQLKRYLVEARKRHKSKRYFVAVIGRSNRKSEVDLKDCFLKTWAEIVHWINQYMSTLNEEDIEERFVLNNILGLLTSEGLGPMKPIKEDILRNYYKVDDLEEQIKGLFRKVRDEIEWSKIMDKIPRSEKDVDKYAPKSIKNHYGRIGIEFSGNYDWNPGCFFGVLLDTEDHGITPPESGPDLCFIISFDRKHHSEYETYPEYETLKIEMKNFEKKLKSKEKGWYFHDHLHDKSSTRKNKWHPLYMRWSFADFIKNHKPEKQSEALRDELTSFIPSFIKECPSFLKLKKKLG